MSGLQEDSNRQSILKRALIEIKELKAKLETIEREKTEPIAIIGIGCRFPGNVSTPEDFWHLLTEGKDTISEVPADRWDIDAYYNSDPAVPGKMSTRWGGFLDDIDLFDAGFFGISPREAHWIDPQQRLLLEVTWEALENAGQTASRLATQTTGIFIGVCNNDYTAINFSDPFVLNAYAGAGSSTSAVANRLSYFYDFHGPSVAVDTACSSSLVALHLASQSLRSGECNLAIAGGVNLTISPEMTVLTTKWGMMSTDGRCKTFDAQADGYVRGEGCGAVVLKRLSAAIADHDPILAVIRGTAINQDGKSNGLTAPNLSAQQAVVQQALHNAGVRPEQVGYIETHGTGTLLGDPIEIEALSRVYAQNNYGDRTCFLGAVKTNIGHLESAAGIAGLIKSVLVIQHGAIPPNLHFSTLNPNIVLDRTPFVIPTQMQPWPASKQPRYAGVSSFGFGGTNAHVIISDAPTDDQLICDEVPVNTYQPTYLLPISARNAEALQDLAQAYLTLCGTRPSSELAHICYTASVRRNHHEQRLCVSGTTLEGISQHLQAYLQGNAGNALFVGRKPAGSLRRLVFVFAGQGTQWAGMGLDLYQREAIFRQTFDQCDRIFGTLAGWSLLAELQAPRLEQTAVVQPLLCAWQMSVAALWRSWGIEPQAVIGHSVGEIAAAQVAGILSLEEAMQVAYLRGQLMQAEYGKGAMLAVTLSAQQAQELIDSWDEQVDVVAINGPRSVVLAGAVQALDAMMERLAQMGITTRRLDVAYAFHSRQMREAGQRLKEALAGLQPRREQVRFCSTVSGDWCQGEVLGASYWERNVAEPVHFAEAVERVSEGQEQSVWVEIGPHGVLGHDLIQGMEAQGKRADVVSSGKRGQEEQRHLRRALSKLYTLGYEPKWDALYPSGGRIVSLPSYPWQREHFWSKKSSPTETQAAAIINNTSAAKHSFLGFYMNVLARSENHCWETTLSMDTEIYLQDHLVRGQTVMPGAVYVEMVIAAVQQTFQIKRLHIEEIHFLNMLALNRNVIKLQVTLTMVTPDKATFVITSRPVEETLQVNSSSHQQTIWTTHAAGQVSIDDTKTITQASAMGQPAVLQTNYQQVLSQEEIYHLLHGQHLAYGPGFQGLHKVWFRDNSLLARLQFSDELLASASIYQTRAVLLDNCFQSVALAAALVGIQSDQTNIYLPVSVKNIRLYADPDPIKDSLWAYTCLRPLADEPKTSNYNNVSSFEGDIQLLNEQGELLLEIQGFQVQRLDVASIEKPLAFSQLSRWLYSFTWQAAPAPPPPTSVSTLATSGIWLLFADNLGIADFLRTHFESQGQRCLLIHAGPHAQRLNTFSYQVRPTHPEDLAHLLQDVYRRGQPGCQGIVYLWHLHATAEEPLSLSQILARQQLGSESLLALVQAVLQQGWRDLPPLWLATQQVYGLPGEATSPLDAPLWGLMRTVRQEHPGLAISAVDLPASLSTEVFEQLFALLRQPQQEDQWLLREQSLSVARLLPWSPTLSTVEVAPAPLLRADSAYLLSGGLGGLGLELLEWLIGQGAGMVIVLSRSAPSEAGQQVLEHLRAQGGHIEVRRVDVAEEAPLSEVLQELRQSGPPLRGVFHLAAVLQDGTIFQQERDGWQQVQRPKVQGGWLLHQLTQQDPLEHFVLFSSVASVLGSAGQSNYAAANAFLDGLAAYRRRRGQPGLSINWGPWAQVGLAAQEEKRGKRLQMRGIQSIKPAEGFVILEKLMREPEGSEQVLVLPLNIRQWRQSYPAMAQAPILSEVKEDALEGEMGKEQEGQILRERLEHAGSERERRQLLETYVQAQLAQILDIEPSRLDTQTPLSTLGLDSLMAIELRNHFEVDLTIKFPIALIWTYPTIVDLVAYLMQEMKIVVDSVQSYPAEEHEQEQLYAVEQNQVLEIVNAVSELTSDELQNMLINMHLIQEGSND